MQAYTLLDAVISSKEHNKRLHNGALGHPTELTTCINVLKSWPVLLNAAFFLHLITLKLKQDGKYCFTDNNKQGCKIEFMWKV